VDNAQRDLPPDDLRQILEDDAARVARRVVRRHKFGRLSDRRIISLLRPHADAVPDRELVDLWFDAFARHVAKLRRPDASA
jgi:hypothetical protein